MNRSLHVAAGLLAVALIAAPGADARAEIVPIDLNTWSQEGPPANGNWIVAADGSSVTQTLNQDPTFFVSPEEFLNTNIQGQISVRTSSDDDFIGFVFGYQSPIAANGDPDTLMKYFLFDWKQSAQTFGGLLAPAGFALAEVDGTFDFGSGTFHPPSFAQFGPSFWAHESSDEFFVHATDFGSGRGWENFAEYEFDLLYQEDRIRIDIRGGTGPFQDGATIFDSNNIPTLNGPFPAGRFGFYNYSQEQVRYLGFTQQEAPPGVPVDPDCPEGMHLVGDICVIPLPAAAWTGLGMLGLLGLFGKMRQRLQPIS